MQEPDGQAGRAPVRATTGAPRFERLLGGSGTCTAAQAVEPLAQLRQAAGERPRVLLNMIASLDGRAALAGHTRRLSSRADIEMMLELRSAADAVLVGSATLRAGGYGRLVRSAERRERRLRAGLAADPLAVVISRGLELPWDAAIFAASEQRVLVYTTSPARLPETEAQVELARLDDIDPAAVLRDLRRRAVQLLLCEGGPTLNRRLLEAAAVDELFLTLSPLVTADDREPAIVGGPALARPREALLRWVLRHGDMLFLRYALSG